MTGPTSAVVGEVVKFTVELVNSGSQPVGNVRVEFDHDPAFVAKTASDGFEPGTLTWNLREFAARSRKLLEICGTCTQAARQVCSRVVVTSPAGDRLEDRACLEARAPAPRVVVVPQVRKLDVAVTDLSNPIVVGSGVTYVIRVSNHGTEPHKDVVVRAAIPPGTMFNRLESEGPAGTTFDVDNSSVAFSPLAELRPQKTVEYRIRLLSEQAGQIRLRAEAASRTQSGASIGEKTTEVLSARE